MVKLSLLAAVVSVLAIASAQDDNDENDDCYDPTEEETTSAIESSASSTAITNSCPSLPAPSTTGTVTLLTAVSTVTEVAPVTTTVYVATVTSTAPQPVDQTSITFETQTVAAATTTVFTGSTFTSVAFSVIPAETTTTVPRPAGFTPLLCESAYVGPYSTLTYPYTSTFSTYSFVDTITISSTTTDVVFPSSLIFPSVTGNFTETVTRQATTTITSVRDDPTSTVYAACQGTDNVSPNAPPSKYKYLGQPVVVEGTYYNVVPAIDQVDCCAQCQALEYCTGSAYYTKPILGVSLNTYLVRTACQLFLKNDTSATCDQSFIGATMSFDYPEVINYYSNGPCGQYNFSTYEPRLVNAGTL